MMFTGALLSIPVTIVPGVPFYLCTVLYVVSITLFYALFRKVEEKKSVQIAEGSSHTLEVNREP